MVSIELGWQNMTLFQLIYSSEESSCLVEGDNLGCFHFLKNSVIPDQDSIFYCNVQNNWNDTGDSKTKGTGTGSNQNSDSPLNNPAYIASIWNFNNFKAKEEKPSDHNRNTQKNNSFDKVFRYSLTHSLNAWFVMGFLILS